MKAKQLLFIAIIGIGYFLLSPSFMYSQTPYLHLEGNVQVDALAGAGNRTVHTDPQGVLFADSIASAKVLSAKSLTTFKNLIPQDSAVAVLQGYYTPGDGGGGVFYYDIMSTEADNDGTIIQPNSVSGNGRWIRLFQDEINVKWFGAKGDQSNDDAPAIQAAIDAIQPLPGGAASVCGTVFFPPGVYVLHQGLKLIDNAPNGHRRNMRLRGSAGGNTGTNACTLLYNGTVDEPILTLFTRDCVIEELSLRVASGKAITTAILIDNPNAGVPATNNQFNNLNIRGNKGLVSNFGAIENGVTVGGNNFGNKELMRFEKCHFEYLDGSGFLIDNFDGQSKQNSFYDCGFAFNRYGIKALSGSFETYSCSFGRLDTAIVLNQSTDNIAINDTDSELCEAFLVTLGNSNGYWPVVLNGGRFGVAQSTATSYIEFYNGGPFTIQNCIFEPQYNPDFKITVGTATAGNLMNATMFNSFGNGFPNDDPYDIDANRCRMIALGNLGYDANVLPVALQDRFAASPVAYGDLNLSTVSGISTTNTPANNLRGSFKLINGQTQHTVVFDALERDVMYYLSITPTKQVQTGFVSIPMESKIIEEVNKTTTGFEVSFYGAPGTGNEVFYEWILVR